MQQCTSAVKPHIVTPVMQMMIDDYTDIGNPSSFSLSYDELSNSNNSLSQVADKTKVALKSSPPPPPPLTLTVPSMAVSSADNEGIVYE